MAENIIFYVDPNAAPGGTGTKEAPYRSLVFAWANAKERLATPGTSITLSLSEGTHILSETLTMNGRLLPDDSSLTVVGVPGKTTITSAVPFDASLFEKAGENLYVADLPQMDSFRYLYVDGKIATMAHSGGKDTDDEDMHTMRYNRNVNFKDDKDAIGLRKVYLHLDLIKPALGDRTSGMVWLDDWQRIEWHIECEWNYNIIHLVGVDLDDTVEFDCETIKDKHYANYFPGVKETHVACYMERSQYTAFSLHPGYPTENRHYFFANHPAFIRKENNYYYDAKHQKVYYYMEGDITAHTFACAQLDNLFRCNAVKNLSFRDITFTGTDNMHLSLSGHNGGQACAERGDFPTQAAFYSKGATNLSFENCRFLELGCEGVRLGGRVDGLTIKNCQFRGLGSAAIRSGEPKLRKFDKEDGTENALIENNIVEDIGREYYEAPGIMFAACKDVTITRNTIRNVPYTGISVGWCWGYNPCPHGELINLTGVYIAYNYITDYMKRLADGGAIYTLGGNAPRIDHTLYNKTEENVVVMSKVTGTGRGVCVMGMYYDGASTNWHSLRNVVVAQSQGADYSEEAENPGYDPRFLWTFHERRRHSVYYFAQDNGVYGANNWSYNVLNEGCYLIRPRNTELFPLNIEMHYCTIGEVEDIIPEDEKDAFLREPIPKGLSHEETLLAKRKKAAARDVINKDMHYIPTWADLPEDAARIISAAGADGAHPDLAELKKDRY